MREVRAKYIATFHSLLRELEAEGKLVAPEVRIEINQQSAQELYRLYVMDFLEQQPDGTVGAIELPCDPIETTYPGLHIDGPVGWSGITFKCRSETFSEGALLAWGNRWIHDESPPLGPQDGLTGVIHSVGEPETLDGTVEFSVDFGSAPIQAFEELVDCLGGSIISLATHLVDREA